MLGGRTVLGLNGGGSERPRGPLRMCRSSMCSLRAASVWAMSCMHGSVPDTTRVEATCMCEAMMMT